MTISSEILAYRDELEGWVNVNTASTYNDDCEIRTGDKVLYVYPAGDCDRAVVEQIVSTFEIRIRMYDGRIKHVIPEALAHLDCTNEGNI